MEELKRQDSEDASATPSVTVGRAATLHDPLTTGLLAEVARRTQTAEFDADVIELMLESIDDDTAEPPVAHPHLQRRQQR